MVVLLQQSVPQTYATCFLSKSIALLKKRRSATLLSSGPSTWVKTSLNTADQPLWIQQTIFFNAFVCLRKSGGVYSGHMKTNGVFLLQDSFTLPYLAGLIWINQKKTNMATTLVSGLVARPLVFLFFLVSFGFDKGQTHAHIAIA